MLGSVVSLFRFVLSMLTSTLRTRLSLQLEIAAPRQQLVEAFPFDSTPRYLLRDGDGIYGERVQRRFESLGIEEVVTAPASPWRSAHVERLIGSLHRELLDHLIILNERHLERLLSSYLDYYHPWRTHRSLDRDAPDGRPVRSTEPNRVLEIPAVQGIHHYYLPKAA